MIGLFVCLFSFYSFPFFWFTKLYYANDKLPLVTCSFLSSQSGYRRKLQLAGVLGRVENGWFSRFYFFGLGYYMHRFDHQLRDCCCLINNY